MTPPAPSAAALTALTLLLAGCGSDAGGTDEPTIDGRDAQTLAGAKSTVTAFAQAIADSDYEGACELIDPLRRAKTCERSLRTLHQEQQAEFTDFTQTSVTPVAQQATGGCMYHLGDGGMDGLGSATVHFNQGQWVIHSIGNLDSEEFVGDQETDIESFDCSKE